MRQPVQNGPADDRNPWLPEINGDPAQRSYRRPTHYKAEGNHEHAQQNPKRRPAVKGPKISLTVDRASEEADLREAKAELVQKYAQC